MAVKTIAKKGFVPSPGIVKQASNVIPRWLIVNSGAGVVAILMVVLAVRGIMHKEIIPQCSERFANGTLFGLQNKAGAPIALPTFRRV